MISRREWIAFLIALAVVILSRGNLPVGLLAGMAAWMVQIERPSDYMTRERRYRMRESRRRRRKM